MRRAMPVAMVALMVSTSIGVYSFSARPPVPNSWLQRVDVPVANGTFDLFGDSFYRALDAAAFHLLDPDLPTRSPLLGGVWTASAAVEQYALRAQASATPLRDAVTAWQAATGLQERRDRFIDQLARADSMPVSLQQDLSVLLYALTDATTLQNEAIRGISDADLGAFLDHIDELDPDVFFGDAAHPEAYEAAAAAQSLAERADMAKMLDGARLLAAAVSKTAASIDRAAEQARMGEAAASGLTSKVQEFYADVADTQRGSPPDPHRLRAVKDYLLLVLNGAGIDVGPDITAVPRSSEGGLPQAIVGLAAAIGVPLNDPALRAQVAAAQTLPAPVQEAVRRLLVAQTGVVGSLTARDQPDGSVESAFFGSLLRFFATLEAVYPTLAAHHYLYRHVAPTLSKSPMDQDANVRATRLLTQALAHPDAGMADMMALLMYLGGQDAPVPAFEPDLTRGSLGRAIAQSLSPPGIPDPSLASNLSRATAMLPEPVERAASRIYQAEMTAGAKIQNAIAGLSPAQLSALSRGHEVASILTAPEVDPDELLTVRDYFSALDALQGAAWGGARLIGDAVDAARDELRPLVPLGDGEPVGEAGADPNWSPPGTASSSASSDESGADAENGDGDGSPVPPGPGVRAANAPVGVGCNPLVPFSDCARDILFRGPVTPHGDGTVVITSDGSGVYHQEQVDSYTSALWIDLGGHDTYYVGAGATNHPHEWVASAALSLLAFNPVYTANIILTERTVRRTSVMLEMGGNDFYATRPDLQSLPKQGAARSVFGSLAFLIDDEGRDVYRADGGISQGGANGLGSIGILLDESGDDQRNVTGFGAYGQGVSAGAYYGLSLPAPGGVGALIDRERGDAAGNDGYGMTTGMPTPGQGASTMGFVTPPTSFSQWVAAGLGILVDAQGTDTYWGGAQGKSFGNNAGGASQQGITASARNLPGGLAIFADLNGEDTYWRPAEEGPPRQNGRCQTGARFAPDLENFPPPTIGFREAGMDGDYFSVYVDLRADNCEFENPNGVPLPVDVNPEDIVGSLEVIVQKIQNGEAVDESDGDGWADLIEFLLGTDEADSDSYPAGYPERPEQWPDGQPYPPPAGPRSMGSGFIVNIPGVLAIGDSVRTTYDSQYQVSLDMAGSDVYTNRPGSDMQAFHLDLGDEDDVYLSGPRALGYWGTLVSAGGDDVYVSGANSQGSAPPDIPYPAHQTARVPAAGFLVDLGGNDTYSAGASSQGFAGQGTVTAQAGTRLGILFDFEGNDWYSAPAQGTIGTQVGSIGPSTVVHGAFHDLAGTDTYITGAQATPTNFGAFWLGVGPFVHWPHFADVGGWDTYVDLATGQDLTALRNDDYYLRANLWYKLDPVVGINVPVPGPTLNLAIRLDAASSWHARDAASTIDPAAQPGDFELLLPGLGLAVGRPGPTDYRSNMALSVDLGGSDAYRNNAGASMITPFWYAHEATAFVGGFTQNRLTVESRGAAHPPRSLAALLLDTEGNDLYDGSDWWTADGLLTNQSRPRSFSNDSLGFPQRNDQLFPQMTQGAGLLGVGMLIDAAGDDVYLAHRYAQGTGVLGVGLVWDRQGQDTYRHDPDVIRDVAVAGNRVAWSDRRSGRWDIFSVTGTGQPVRVSPAPGAGSGPRLDHFDPAVAVTTSGEIIFWVARNHASTALWRSVAGGPPEVLYAPLANVSAPSAAGAHLLFVEEDADGTSLRHTLSTLDPLFFQASDLAPSANPQRAPVMFAQGGDARAAWLEWNPTNGTWDVWTMNVGAGLAPRRVNSGLQDADRPSIYGNLVAWQEWSPSTEWDIYATNLDDPLRRILVISDGPGNQTQPAAGPGAIAYVDEAGGRLQVWEASRMASRVLLTSELGFASPVFEPFQGFEVVTLRLGPESGGVGRIPDVVTGCLAVCQNRLVFDSQTASGSMALQGASVYRGYGILLEEAGDDTYVGWRFAQGAAFSSNPDEPNTPTPFTTFNDRNLPDGNYPFWGNRQGNIYEQSDRAMLADLDGHDRYEALSHSQGAHASAILIDQAWADVGEPPPPYVGTNYAGDHSAILYDVRGNDRYHAVRLSQGIGSLSLGASVAYDSGNSENPRATEQSPFTVNSLGVLHDTGGADLYLYQETVLPFSVFEVGAVDVGSDAPQDDDRNGKTWRQHAMRMPYQSQAASPDGGTPSNPDDYPDGSRTGVWLAPGGVGIDSGAYDEYAAAFQQAADDYFQVEVRANDDETGGPGLPAPTLRDTVLLSAAVSNSLGVLPVDVRSVEFVAVNETGSEMFLGSGRDPACDYCVTWSTNSSQWPDGQYGIRARANLAPRDQGLTMGAVEGTGLVNIDNMPRITAAAWPGGAVGLTPFAFAPDPFPGSGLPDHIDYRFDVSRHLDGTTGIVQVDVVRDDAGGRQLIASPTPATRVAFAGATFRLEDSWDGRVGGLPVPDGPYTMVASAIDDESDPSRRAVVELPFLVDSSKPGPTCIRLPQAPTLPCGVHGLVPESATENPVLDTVQLTLAWDPSPLKPQAAIGRYFLFHCRPSGDTCPDDGWTMEIFGPQQRRNTFADLRHGDRLHAGVLAEDILGNLEAAQASDTDVWQVFLRKAAAGDILRIQLDRTNPDLLAVVLVDGQPSALPYVNQHADALIEALAGDDLGTVTPRLQYLNLDSQVLDVPIHPFWDEESGQTVFRGESLRNLTDVAAWPGGTINYQFLAVDAAGNQASAVGAFLYDNSPPAAGSFTRVEYAESKGYAQEGDLLRIIVEPSDVPPPPSTVGSLPEHLRVIVDVSALNPELGELTMERFRRTVHNEFYEETIPVTAPSAQGVVVHLPVTLIDQAGNVGHAQIEVVHGRPTFGLGQPQVVNRTHESLEVEWTSATASRGRLEYGTSSSLGQVLHAGDEPSTTHRVLLQNLTGRTTYFFRAVGDDGAGLVERGPLRTNTTLSGLSMGLDAPPGGQAFQDVFQVRWDATLLADPSEALEYEVAIRPAGTGAFFPVGRFFGPQGPNAFALDPLEFSDGTFEVRLIARSGSEEVQELSAPFVIDRRRPQVLPESPSAGAQLPAPPARVVARVMDALSGVDPTALRLEINGEPVPVAPADLIDGRLEVPVANAFQEGLNTISLDVRDLAGNSGRATWRVVVDRTPPVFLDSLAEPPSGQGRLKHGDALQVQVRVLDDSQVSAVWLRPTNLSELPRLDLDARGDGKFVGTLIADRETFLGVDPGGSVQIEAFAQDVHGRTTPVPHLVHAPVSVGPPRLERFNATLSADDPMLIHLDLAASQPVRWTIEGLGGRVDGAANFLAGAPQTDVRYDVRRTVPFTQTAMVRLRLLDDSGQVTTVERVLPVPQTLPQGPPNAPNPLRVSPGEAGAIHLRWDAPVAPLEVLEYWVYRSNDGGSAARIAVTSDRELVDQPPAARQLRYEVRAVDMLGRPGAPTDAIAVQPLYSGRLSDVRVDPPIGFQHTPFAFRATFTHPLGDVPAAVRILIDGQPYDMSTSETNCADGCTFLLARGLPVTGAASGPVRYVIEASGDSGLVRSPSGAESHAGPLVLADPGMAASAAQPDQARIAGVPGPGLLALALALGLAAGARRQATGGRRHG